MEGTNLSLRPLLFVKPGFYHVQQNGKHFVVCVSDLYQAFCHQKGIVPTHSILFSEPKLVFLNKIFKSWSEEQSVDIEVSRGGVISLRYFVGSGQPDEGLNCVFL